VREAGEGLVAGSIGGRLGVSSYWRLPRVRLNGAGGSKSLMRRGESIVGIRKVCAIFAGNNRSELLVDAAEVAYRDKRTVSV